MTYDELLRIGIPGFIILICALIYNHNAKSTYKTIGELEYRVRIADDIEHRLKTRLAEKDTKIAEQYALLEDREHEIGERKEDTKALRSIVNRHEGRISVYVENEASYLKELAQLRTSTLVAQAKAQALEVENRSLLRQLAQQPADESTPPAA